MRGARLLILCLAAAVLPGPIHAQGTLSALQTDVEQIAQTARGAVVTVVAQHSIVSQRLRTREKVLRLHTRVGSGVAVGDNEILTTASVVLGAEHVFVRTASGTQVEGRVTGTDLIFNVALIRVSGLPLEPVRIAKDPELREGDWVITLGTSYHGQPTRSVGNVAVIYRDPRQPVLELTNTVFPGNSGGAALNSRGELVGIVQGELGLPELVGRGPDAERRPSGASFVQPIDVVLPVLTALRSDGHVRHGYLGVSTRSASVESDTQQGLKVPIGAIVEAVQPGGPADGAGIQRGDLIVGFDGNRAEYADQLARWVAGTRPGRTVEMVWVRDDVRHSRRLTLTESPDAAPRVAELPGPRGSEAPTASARIGELERQIRELSNELKRLQSDSSSSVR